MSAATNFGGHSNFTLPEASSTPNGAEENQRDSTKGRSMPPLAPLERNSATDVVGNDDSMELGLDACAAMAVAMAMAIDGAGDVGDVGDNDNDGDGDPKISDSACADSNQSQSQSQSQNLYQTTKQDQNQDQKPKPKPKPSNAVDDLLTKDLMDMSVRDRASISEELHGVRSLAVDENDGDDNKNKELVTNALLDLNHALEHRIPAHKKMAFIRAQSLGQTAGTYVNDVTFRLKFLRCKLFDVNEAAWLLVNYLELTRELFGDVCLVRTIRLEDVQATKEERVAFRLGYIQLLPFGDRAGRRIVVISTDALHYSTLIRVKILLYIWTVASNDVATQRNGAILICWDGRKDMALPRPSEQQLVRKLFSAIPLRICGIHFCFPDTPFFRMARAIFTLTVVRAEHRNRLRFHVGEETELKYQVGTFGIPVTQIPITETGNIKVGSFHKWIGMRKRVEENEASETALRRQRQSQLKLQMQAHSQHQMQHQQQQHQQHQQQHQQHQQHQQPATNNWQIQMQMQMQVQMLPVQYTGTIGDHSIGNDVDDTNSTSKPSLFVEYPGLNDVAFRKGMSLMHHPGNDYFHGLIQSKMLEHGKSTQTGKARIAWGVVDEIRKRNGRFLSWHHQGWWAVLEDESKIRLRVAVFFREWKKHLKAEKNRQTMITSSKSAYKFQRLQGGFRRKSCDSLSSLDYSSNSTETSND